MKKPAVVDKPLPITPITELLSKQQLDMSTPFSVRERTLMQKVVMQQEEITALLQEVANLRAKNGRLLTACRVVEDKLATVVAFVAADEQHGKHIDITPLLNGKHPVGELGEEEEGAAGPGIAPGPSASIVSSS